MQINPKDPHPWDMLGNLHYDNKDYATAEGNYRRAVSLDTFGGQYLSHLARCLAKEGKMDEARSVADQARGLGVTVPDSIFNTIDNLKNKIHIPSIGGFHF
jgi:Flp pilus assembly protein TadD